MLHKIGVGSWVYFFYFLKLYHLPEVIFMKTKLVNLQVFFSLLVLIKVATKIDLKLKTFFCEKNEM